MKIRDIYFGYISVLKNHYIVMIILPIYFIFSGVLMMVLRENHKYPMFNKVILVINIGFFLLFLFLPIFYLFKRKRMKAFYLFLTPIITMIITNKVLDNYKVDPDGINFFIHREEYQHIIENSPSMATDGGAKLVKIEMSASYYACEKYLVYDESDEMSNKFGNFRGIGYLYIEDIVQHKKVKIDADVEAKKYAEHIYIADVCADTGQ